ncbi:MAG TPA: AgmX/PglI C-terminal domain-containing protein [Polyangia bacterium]|nr:AgmX/PglI C-terminal domain-containing protein [Polyangia bacterium]
MLIIRRLLPLLLLLAARPAAAHNVRFTIVSARLDGARLPSGLERGTSYTSDLTCVALPGLRALGDFCASGKLPQGASAVDSLVRVEIKDAVIRTYPIPASLTPTWQYSAMLDTDYLTGKDDARFVLLDYEPDGSEKKLGDALVPLKTLLKAGTHTVKAGPHSLTYQIETLRDDAAPRTYALRVPGDRQVVELARAAKVAAQSASGGYVLIPLAEGEIVEVTASGKVQPSAKKHPERVAGPDGIPTIQTKIQFNQPGFRGCAGCDHAALIAVIGTTRLVIGSKKKFTVEKSGLLVMGVNDVKVEDNAGGFDVKVTVSAPEVTPAAIAPSTKKGSASDAPGAAIDPRVVEQIVDAHGAELDACAADQPNPYGDVVLSFVISADGSLVGVNVEKASPNLKAAGECMRKKALAWRFPAPRGVVTVRYPVSFSAGG